MLHVALDEAEAGGAPADAIFFLHRSRLIFGTVLHGFGPYRGMGRDDRSRLIISGPTLPASHVLVLLLEGSPQLLLLQLRAFLLTFEISLLK